jgi:hypothetical protein
MIVESLVGTIVGGVLRLIPEGLKFWESKKDADHEFRMAQLSLDTMKFQASAGMDLKRQEGLNAREAGELQALIEGNKSQTAMVVNTGIKWVDAFIISANAMMRPTMVYYYMGMYALVKVAVFYTYLGDGIDWKSSMILLWSTEDSAVWASIASFVFLDRTLRKNA